MAGSDSSVRGGHHGEQEPPVARAELHQLQNSLLEAMERMFNERLPAAGGRGPHQEESGDENSGFGNGFHDRFGNGHGVGGGGRRADFYQQSGRRRAIFVISVEEDMDVIVMCILMINMMLVMTMIKNLMTIKTLLLAMDGLDSTMIVIEVLVMMEDIIVVIIVGMI